MSKNIAILINRRIEKNFNFRNYAHLLASVIYFDKDSRKPRNWGEYDGKKDFEYFHNLFADCQMSADNDHAYGFKVSYHEPFRVDIRNCEKMVKTLRKIEKKINKLNDEFGEPRTFGEYVSRFAKAVGAKTVIFYEDYDNINLSYDNNHYREYKVGVATGVIDNMANECIKEIQW